MQDVYKQDGVWRDDRVNCLNRVNCLTNGITRRLFGLLCSVVFLASMGDDKPLWLSLSREEISLSTLKGQCFGGRRWKARQGAGRTPTRIHPGRLSCDGNRFPT